MFKQSGKNLKLIQKSLTRYRQKVFPKLVGDTAVEHFQDSFSKKKFNGKSWKPRKNKTKGSLLVKSGALKRSIRVTRRKPGYVVVGSNIPYASIHNYGGTVNTTAAIGRHRRKAHVRGNKFVRSSVVKEHTRKVNFSMPKRQFVGNSRKARSILRRAVSHSLTNLFK